MAAVDVAREFWRLMGTNDFSAVGAVLADDFVLEWPLVFTIDRVVGGEAEAVTDVTVTDGSRRDRAITWPEPFAAPANRAHLVE